nr:DUF262 domain-containing protein [Pseudomonas sp. NMI760_13]
MKKSPQFVIPIYQRNYSWTEAQCQQLWSDLLRSGRDEQINGHFIGSIVYVERGLSTVTTQEALLVIDGQQRLTTCTLLIAALAKHFEANQLPELLDSFSARKLHNYYLLNPEEDGERHYKLILSETDKKTLLAIIKSAPMPAEISTRIEQNYTLFQALINKHQDELKAICQGLAKLLIVEVSLDRTQDNPQLIFESMNSTGLELSQADLIRNYILMGLEPKLQTELYQSYWRPMEKSFGQKAYVTHFDPFMRHYLTAKTGEIPNVREVYAAFKAFARASQLDTTALVADIHAYASYYCAMALGAETESKLKEAFHDLRELKVDVAYTIEHILPQNEVLSSAWQAELGPDWQQTQQKYLHTLGNLTLTGYNSEYSDYPFAYKRDQVINADGKKIGFKYSALNINEGLGEVEKWDESAIKTRAERLAREAAKVWAAPQLDSSVLDAYRPSATNAGQHYGIDDHPHLTSGTIRTLFDALRKEILELDPCIYEEYLKLYVAYKAETNFVDVVPQARRLRLSLNMPFSEIDDPKGLCTDVTNLGRWGNGDVEVGLSSLDELPYVMGLIRQSFDRQMGDLQDA